MFVVVAHYYAKEGKDDEIAAILEQMVTLSRSEPGCLVYYVNRSLDDPRKFLLYEQYRTRDDYEAHKASAAFQENIIGKVIPMLESRVPEFYELVEPVGK
ncbi:MAG: antibiotic biosynthesis monooxygenase [Chloroflexota bacterium]